MRSLCKTLLLFRGRSCRVAVGIRAPSAIRALCNFPTTTTIAVDVEEALKSDHIGTVELPANIGSIEATEVAVNVPAATISDNVEVAASSTKDDENTKKLNNEFYEMIAEAMIARIWPTPVLNRYIRMMGLCGNDPASIKLYLARSATHTSSSRFKFLLDILWSLVDMKPIAELSIPPKENPELCASLNEALQASLRFRHQPLSALGSATPTSRTTSNTLTDELYKNIPEGLIEKIVATLNNYCGENVSDEEMLKILIKDCGIYGSYLYPLFNYLSLPVSKVLKKKISAQVARRELLKLSAFDEIKVFNESVPSMVHDSKKKTIFKKSFRSQTEWTSRTYGRDHCLNVNVNVTFDDRNHYDNEIKSGVSEPRLCTEWTMSEDVNFDSPYKIFLRNLPTKVKIEDIRAAFVGCDPDVHDRVDRSPVGSLSSRERRMRHYLELSPVIAIHLVSETPEELASKFLFDIPRRHEPEVLNYTDGTNSELAPSSDLDLPVAQPKAALDSTVMGAIDDLSTAAASLSKTRYLPQQNIFHDKAHSIMAAAPSEEAAQAALVDLGYQFTSAANTKQNFSKNLEIGRVKTALIKQKVPESYAFVVLKNYETYSSATTDDMKVLGLLIAGSMTYVNLADTMSMLIFEVNYGSRNLTETSASDIDDALCKISSILPANFDLKSPTWEHSDISGNSLGIKPRKISQNDGPKQPAFIHLRFDSHSTAWKAYKILNGNPASPGQVSWIKSKHYKWVAKQTEAVEKISAPLLVDSFFRKGGRNTIDIVPDLNDSSNA